MTTNLDYSRFVSNGGDIDVELSPPQTPAERLAEWASRYGEDDDADDDGSIRRRGGGNFGA